MVDRREIRDELDMKRAQFSHNLWTGKLYDTHHGHTTHALHRTIFVVFNFYPSFLMVPMVDSRQIRDELVMKRAQFIKIVLCIGDDLYRIAAL